jgi:hypothetical protein
MPTEFEPADPSFAPWREYAAAQPPAGARITGPPHMS